MFILFFAFMFLLEIVCWLIGWPIVDLHFIILCIWNRMLLCFFLHFLKIVLAYQFPIPFWGCRLSLFTSYPLPNFFLKFGVRFWRKSFSQGGNVLFLPIFLLLNFPFFFLKFDFGLHFLLLKQFDQLLRFLRLVIMPIWFLLFLFTLTLLQTLLSDFQIVLLVYI